MAKWIQKIVDRLVHTDLTTYVNTKQIKYDVM